MQQVCERIQLTPRSLKRIANVMKLIKLYWHRRDQYASVDVVRTVVSLLALSARYPEVMRDAFVELEGHYRRDSAQTGGNPLGYRQFFHEFIDEHAPRNASYLQLWKDQIRADVDDMLPEGIGLLDVDIRTFNLARSFSFVGDPAPSIETPQRVELVGERLRRSNTHRRQWRRPLVGR
jgi:hypothetical protein